MNPDLKPFQTNRKNTFYWENKQYTELPRAVFTVNSLNNPRIKRYFSLLDSCNIDKSVVEHLSDFFRYLLRRNRSIRTVENYFQGVKRFVIFAASLDIKKLEFVHRDHLGAFIEYLQDNKLACSTINSYLKSLYVFLGFLEKKGVISPDIMRNKFKLKMPDLLPRAIDPSDIKQFLSVIDTARERALILVLLRTGMRIGELLGTKIIDVNLPEKRILIPQAQKNYEGRAVYMSDDACFALKVWFQKRLPDREYIFYGRGNRERLSYAMARHLFMQCLKKADLSCKGYTLHCLRHTFASELLNAGMRLECLQILLGHQTIEETRRYARLTDNTRKKEYFKAMDRIERGELNGHYRFHN